MHYSQNSITYTGRAGADDLTAEGKLGATATVHSRTNYHLPYALTASSTTNTTNAHTHYSTTGHISSLATPYAPGASPYTHQHTGALSKRPPWGIPPSPQ